MKTKNQKSILYSLLILNSIILSVTLTSTALAAPSDYCILTVGDEFRYSYNVYNDGILYDSAPFNATINILTNTSAGGIETTRIDYTLENGTNTQDKVRWVNSTDVGVGYTYGSVFGACHEILFVSKLMSPHNNFTVMSLGFMTWNLTANYTAQGVLYHFTLDNPDFNGVHRIIECNLVSSTMTNNVTTPGGPTNNGDDIPGFTAPVILSVTSMAVLTIIMSYKRKNKISFTY